MGFFVGDKDVYEVTGTLLRYEDSLNSEFGAYKGYIVRCTKMVWNISTEW